MKFDEEKARVFGILRAAMEKGMHRAREEMFVDGAHWQYKQQAEEIATLRALVKEMLEKEESDT